MSHRPFVAIASSLVLYTLVLAGNAFAGTGGAELPEGTSTGNLVGFVKANDIYTGTPISGATVTLNGGQSTTTDSSGYYAFKNVPVGTYTVTAEATCYDVGEQTEAIQAGVDNWISIALFEIPECSGDDGTTDGAPACLMGTTTPGARIHTASVSPLDRLPWSSAGFFFGLGGCAILWRRRRH